jgi:hypothetical protein
MDEVPVERIISAPNMESWGKVDRSEDYLARMIKDIRSGKLDLKKIEPPYLNEYGGGYMVGSDGRTRVAVSKMEGLETLGAEVKQVVPDRVVVFSHKDFETLEERRRDGLWTGEIHEESAEGLNDWGIDFYATGKIEKYNGVWVFARDMERAKTAYDSIGVTGNASISR